MRFIKPTSRSQLYESIRNSFTKKVLKLPVNGDLLSFATSPTAVDQIELKRGNTITYTSPSYIDPPEDKPQARRGDIAFILRRPIPKNELCSVVVFAGVRRIGTWGASDHLRKYAKKLSARVAKDQGNAIKQGFLAVIAADYENFDIVQTKVKDVSTVVEDA